jgi:hypothetical protein
MYLISENAITPKNAINKINRPVEFSHRKYSRDKTPKEKRPPNARNKSAPLINWVV